MRTPATTSTERRAHFLGSVVVSSSSHTCSLAQVCAIHPISIFMFTCAVSSPWSSLSISCSTFRSFSSSSTTWSLWYTTPATWCGRLWRPPPLHRLWAQGPHDFYETTVEPYVQLLDSPPVFSNSLFQQSLFCGPRLRWRYTRRHAPSSTSSASLSVCRRRLCPIQGDRWAPKLRSTMNKKTIAAKFGISWSSSKKSHWNGRVKDVSEFCIRHYGKTKIRRGSEHKIGTFWPSTGIAKWSKLYERSKGFQDAESVRSGNSHVASRPVSFPPHPICEGMLRHSFLTPSRREGPPSIWDSEVPDRQQQKKEWRWHLLKKSRCWDVSLTGSRHRWLKRVNSHEALRWTQQCPDSRKLWEQWDSRCRNRAQKTWESRKARAVRTWQRLWRLGLHIQRIRWYDWSCFSCLAEDSETITNSGDGDSTTRTAVCNLAVPIDDARTERSTESREERWKQLFRSLQTSVPDVRNVRSGRQHGIIRAKCDQDWRRGRPSERISGTGETTRWSGRYRSRSRPSDKGVHYFEHAWASEDTSSVECWKRGNFNALRVATEDYLRSRRIFKTTSTGNTHDEDSMEVDAVSRKRERQREIRQGQEGWVRKEKKATQAKVTEKRQQKTHDSMKNVETVESMDTKLLIVGTSRRTNLKVKARARESRNPRWQTTVNKSMLGIQVQTRPHSSQIYLKWTRSDAQMRDSWIFSLEDSKKRRYTVNWDETNLIEKWKTEEHEFIINSGCFGHVCPPWFAPQFPMFSSTNVHAVAANNVALQHYGQKSGLRTRDDEQR